MRVANELVYAPVNNWGGEVHPTVTPQMRRFAWAKYYQASGKAKKAATGKRKGKKLRIKIPQRQFIGESRELSEKIDRKMENEIRNILNL